jgi:hypothetical protein
MQKDAVNALRLLARANKLSPEAIQLARSRGMYPTAERMTAGLNRGTDAMKKKYNILESPEFPGKTPTQITVPTYGASGTIPFTNKSFSVMNQRKPVSDIIDLPSFKNLPRSEQEQLAAVVRRHEAREGVRGQQAIRANPILNESNPFKRVMNFISGKTRAADKTLDKGSFRSHMGPEILLEEGKSLAGLSPNVIGAMRDMRSTSGELKALQGMKSKKIQNRLQSGQYLGQPDLYPVEPLLPASKPNFEAALRGLFK